jgi:tetratricopeptide (TPR) repeat protein
VKRIVALLLLLVLVLPAMPQDDLDGGALGQQAQAALETDNLIKLREVARQMLIEKPDSIPGHFFMAYSLHRSEGDLPRARYHLVLARQLFEKRFGTRPGPREYGIMSAILEELINVSAEMDLYTEQIEAMDAFNACYQYVNPSGEPPIVVEYAWPLMKLGKEQEAREKIKQSLDQNSIFSRTVALNTLGAIEMETGQSRKSYEVFKQLLKEVGPGGGCTFLRNGGEAAYMVGDFAQAERYYLQATEYFESQGFSNPWWDLANLYTAEARLPEAVQALQRMYRWSAQMEYFLSQQDYAEHQQATAELALQLGLSQMAMECAQRSVIRPDRQGGNSNQRDQWEAGNLLVYRSTLLNLDQALQEEMSWSHGSKWWSLYLRRQSLAYKAWSAGRRAVAIAAENDRVVKSLRVFSAGTIMMADWHRPDLVVLYGPGVVSAGLEELRQGNFDDLDHQEPYLKVLEAEVNALTGNPRRALELLDDALKTLPAAELLVRQRAQARAAQLEEQAGQMDKAMARYQQVLETAPAMLRLLAIRLPVRVEGATGDIRRSILASPRFRADEDGLKLAISGTGPISARLSGPDGSVLAEAMGENKDKLLENLHQAVFSPKINLNQTDIDGLDGSNQTGDPNKTNLQEMFKQP